MSKRPTITKICDCGASFTAPINNASRMELCPECREEFEKTRPVHCVHRGDSFKWVGIDISVNPTDEAKEDMAYLRGNLRSFAEIKKEVEQGIWPAGFIGESEGRVYRVKCTLEEIQRRPMFIA